MTNYYFPKILANLKCLIAISYFIHFLIFADEGSRNCQKSLNSYFENTLFYGIEINELGELELPRHGHCGGTRDEVVCISEGNISPRTKGKSEIKVILPIKGEQESLTVEWNGGKISKLQHSPKGTVFKFKYLDQECSVSIKE